MSDEIVESNENATEDTAKAAEGIDIFIPFDYPNMVFVDMPESNNSGMSFSKTFHVKYTHPDSGLLYTGDFTCTRSSIGKIIEQGVVKARLTHSLPVDETYSIVASWLSYTIVMLTKKPDWWKPETSFDLEALHAMHDYVFAWERSFRLRSVANRRKTT